jgi:AraC-like DNA-binding protein
MNYIEYSPSHILAPYVDRLWYCHAETSNITQLTIPLVYHELVLNFSTDYKIADVATPHHYESLHRTWISGLRTTSYFSKSQGRHEMMGVLFRFDGLKSFIKIQSSEFSNGYLDASIIFGRHIDETMEKMDQEPSIDNKFKLLEKFLIQFFKPHHMNDRYHSRSMSFKATIDDYGHIRKLCNELGVSNKSLIENYKTHIGLSPSKFNHLLTINKAMHLIAKHPNCSLTQLAYDLNFYDQSHFIHIFKTMTHLTPKTFAQYVLDNKIDPITPNFISV